MTAAENVALGKKAVLFPEPNYRLCTDPEDASQITDGQLSRVSGYWTQKSTVGWKNAEPGIVIDLERVEPIESISIRSVGNLASSGISFPKEIVVNVSDDGEIFHEVARLTPKGLRRDGKRAFVHAFTAEGLKTRGRYVMVNLKPGGFFVFTDEIAVNRGAFDPETVVFSGPTKSRAEMAFNTIGLTPESYTRGHFPETPHTDWADPLAGKPVRAILMSDFRYMRDVVEVAQRLGVKYTPVPFSKPLPGPAKELLIENLPHCDVLVAGSIDWRAMPPELLEKIRTRVREGMGFVLADEDLKWVPLKDLFAENPLPGDQGILDLVPVTLIPGYHPPKDGTHFRLATYGRGRVALLDSSAFTRPARWLLPEFTHEDYIEGVNGPLEYWFAAFNKLALWAAGRENRQIAEIETSPQKVAAEILPGASGTLRVVVRDPFFQPVRKWQVVVPAKGGRFEFTPPDGGRGTWAVDVWLLDDKGAVRDFGSGFFKRDSEVGIASVTAAKPLFAPGEPVEALVKVSQPIPGLTLRASLFDTDGREISAPKILPLSADGKTAVSLPYPHPLTLGATLQIKLLKDGKLLDERHQLVWVELPVHHDFTVLGWTVKDAEQPVAAAGMKTLRKLGVDGYAGLYKPNRAENAALGNLRFAPENIARIAPPHPPGKDGIREPSLSDPVFRQTVEKKLRAMARDSRTYGVTEWSLGDEESLGKSGDEYDFSPHSLAEFREWLKGQYANLSELNESWETSYKNWAEVSPALLRDLKPDASFASWLDFRRFMESVFADYHARAGQVIKAENPAARVGLSGSQNPNSYNGYDWWKLMQVVDHVSGYPGVQAALQRDFKRHGTFLTTFIGYDFSDSDEQGAHGQPWKVLFGGANGLNYFSLMAGALPCAILRPDLSPTNKAAWIVPEIQELKSGTALLFMQGVREDDGIGILYSPASVHSATASGLVDPANMRKNFGTNLTSLTKLLSDSHYQYRFVHEEQLAQGELKRFKLLFLPWSSALSVREATAIRQFVKDGGTLIADSFAGVRDGHGKPRAMLEDVFGVTQPLAPPTLTEGELKIEDKEFLGPKEIPVATGIVGIQLQGGVARGTAGGAPAFIVHPYGKGRAIFLNASFSNYSDEVPGGEGGEITEGGDAAQGITGPIRAFVTALLTESGVPVPVPVRSSDAKDAEVEVSRFKLGNAQLLGVLRSITGGAIHRDDRVDFTLELGHPWNVYDIRERKFLGKIESIRESLPRGLAKAYALLPYRVNAVTLSGTDHFSPGEAARFQFAVSADGHPGTHVLHMTVTGPDGNERPAYAQNIVAPKGKAEAVLPFAWNDTEGEWTITVHDATTGVAGSKTVRLETRKAP